MTCAEEGKFVNLTANATREDIYGRVADIACAGGLAPFIDSPPSPTAAQHYGLSAAGASRVGVDHADVGRGRIHAIGSLCAPENFAVSGSLCAPGTRVTLCTREMFFRVAVRRP